MHTSWLPEKPAATRSAQGRDKVQTCYSHQGNNDTFILGENIKSLEADYSNRLARSLVASCEEISPFP